MDAIYLDHAATTPLRDEVRAAMEPLASETFGNPSSSHRWGRAAAAALEEARAELADAIGARPAEIVFVRGGTESDNLAVAGSTAARAGDNPLVVVTRVEHSAVLEAARALEAAGAAELVELDVRPTGEVDLDALSAAIAARSALVSAMRVNNETGLELPVPAIVEVARGHGVVVHTDASQAIGKVPVDVRDLEVDLLTGTGHKIYGPSGMGFLFVRSGTRLVSPLHGGGQERGLRPGTEDVGGAVGLARAVRMAVEEQEDTARRFAALRQRLEEGLAREVDGLRVNCSEGPRAPHVSSVGIPGISDGAALLMALDLEGLAVSGGSACHSGATGGSHVIAALYGDADALATVRYSFGRPTTEEHIDRAVAITSTVVRRLQAATSAATEGSP